MRNSIELGDSVQNPKAFDMIKRKNSLKKTSIPVPLFIVEGYTEYNYINLIKKIYHKDVAIENCKGGGAKSVLLLSDRIIKNDEQYYESFVIMYDLDTYNRVDEPLKVSISAIEAVEILEFDPCFENWLLQHFQDKKIKTADCSKCVDALEKHIPNYKKNDFKMLEKYINEGLFIQACDRQPIIGNVLKEYFFITTMLDNYLANSQL